MAFDPIPLSHPVPAAVDELQRVLAGVDQAPLWSLSAAETTQVVADLGRVAAALAELTLRVAVHADTLEVAAEAGARSTAVWWAHATGQDRGDAARRLQVAHALDGRYARVRAALAGGTVSEEAAGIIVRALDALPEDLDAVTAARAEEVMVTHAGDLPPRQLRLAGKALLAVIAPDLADAHEEKLLTAEERRAEEAMRLSMWDDGHGTTHGRFTLPTLQATMLRKMLTAVAACDHEQTGHGTAGSGAPTAEPPEGDAAAVSRRFKPTPQRLAEALCELIERYAGDKLPTTGGTPATVVVTMTLDAFTGGPGAATLDTGEHLSAGAARRLACQAGIIPMVLGGTSVPLDLGRRRRFHTEAQRIAIAHRDRTCTTLGCDMPAHLCHVHHDTPWSRGGPTTVKDARLLCPRHHRHIHDPAYTTTHHPTGHVEFHRRP